MINLPAEDTVTVCMRIRILFNSVPVISSSLPAGRGDGGDAGWNTRNALGIGISCRAGGYWRNTSERRRLVNRP